MLSSDNLAINSGDFRPDRPMSNEPAQPSDLMIADPGGFDWHHRILLHRIQGGIWLTLTPDHELQRHDLNAIPHRVLGRKSTYPEDIADAIYAHDPISRTVLQGFKRDAKIRAAILGEGEVDETESHVWVIAQAGHSKFGAEIDENLLFSDATGLAFNERGVVVLDGEELFVEKVMDKDLASWKAQKNLDTGDLRLLGDFKDSGGKRKRSVSGGPSDEGRRSQGGGLPYTWHSCFERIS